MTVRVLFFAKLRDLFGASERRMSVPPGAAIHHLLDRLEVEAGLSLDGLPLRYAVNEEFCGGDVVLRENDVLALMTPMSGG